MSRQRLVDLNSYRAQLVPATQIRVIYSDTDQMRVVYHANYLQFMERGRVEFMRAHGIWYAEMERAGTAFPVVDTAVSYLNPAHYDDLVTVHVALSRVSPARVNFQYLLTVEPGDRHELKEPLEIIAAETRHGCMDLTDGAATRIPDEIYARLEAAYHQQAGTDKGK